MPDDLYLTKRDRKSCSNPAKSTRHCVMQLVVDHSVKIIICMRIVEISEHLAKDQ